MTSNEMLLFATALVFWSEHRQGGDLDDAADIGDGFDSISEKSRVHPTAIEKMTIVGIYAEILSN
jgi:hypothetical protein